MEIGLAIIDDDVDFLKTFSDYAARTVGFSPPATYSSASQALRDIARKQFDVILVDLLIGRVSGCDLIHEIKTLKPDARLLVLSAHSEDHFISEALALGADGYLLKTQSLREILDSIKNYFGGGVAIEPNVIRKVIGKFRAERAAKNSIATDLTPRETTILNLLAKGNSYKEIAATLELCPQTVYSHSKRMFRKLGVKSKTEAVVKFLRTQPASPSNTLPGTGT